MAGAQPATPLRTKYLLARDFPRGPRTNRYGVIPLMNTRPFCPRLFQPGLRLATAALLLGGLLHLPGRAHAAPTVFSATGADAASITPARDAFRTALGGGTTAGANGSFGGARREVNWDGVPATFSAPNNLPPNFFNSNSPRGVVFSTPGSGFRVSGATTDTGSTGQPAAANFGDIDASYSTALNAFTAQRLFTPLGSTKTTVKFFLPGTGSPAGVNAFGAVFSDVDRPNISSIEFFYGPDSVGKFFVPATAGTATFSFLGVVLDPGVVATSVEITTGNVALAAGAADGNGNTNDVVAMDDFLYSEPVHPPFFNGEVALSNNVFFLQFPGTGNLFGFYTYEFFPFLFHFDLGFVYFIDARNSQNGVFLYDFQSDTFWYTSPSYPFPYLFDFRLNSVIYYFRDPTDPNRYSRNPRYFFNFGTNQVITK